MCGFAGFFRSRSLTAEEVGDDLRRMAGSLQHRGPDDEGFWHDVGAGIALCHRRLAIIDLSASGHQPMSSPAGRYTIAFNGEIYNYRDLRKELGQCGYSFKGGSDTEVLLAAIDHWGVQAAVERCIGMFAFALWDRDERTLVLARDPFGEKPLYYGVCADTLLFGSELKALRQHHRWSDEIDRNAVALLMQNDSVPAPFSIFEGIKKLSPGCCLTVQVRNGQFRFNEHRYWRIEELFAQGARASEGMTEAQSLQAVDDAISTAVGRQMVADVPLGAFLSGGVDSSLVVAYMQKATSRPVKTFSIGFREQAFDESRFARAVAQHLGTDHTELILTPRECLEVIPQLPQIYDEPFADPSQIPTYLVSRLARQSVTVALSGDGGDELFGGYSRYLIAMAKWRRMRRVPAILRSGGSALVERLPPQALQLLAKSGSLWSRRFAKRGLAYTLPDKSLRWRASTLDEFYRTGLRRWQGSWQPAIGANAETHGATMSAVTHTDELKQLMYADTCSYLPNDILVKVDRAAMSVSLETRIPLLDPGVARAAWSVPSNILLKDGRGKWVLRALLEQHVPKKLMDRPKSGFAIPLAQWLRADLRPWATDLLDAYQMRQEGFLDVTKVQHRWRQHLNNDANWAPHLWNVLMFQSWLRQWRSERVAPRFHAKAS
jgi:asparagine synthase (glutamine-hydrolysing)